MTTAGYHFSRLENLRHCSDRKLFATLGPLFPGIDIAESHAADLQLPGPGSET